MNIKFKDSPLASKSTFIEVAEQIADAVIITTTQGEIQYVNPSFSFLTGYKSHEVIGKTPRVLKSSLHDTAFYRNMWRTILRGESFRSIIINRKKSGELFYADHTIMPVKDQGGKIIFLLGIWKDISKRHIEEKNKDDFLNIAGHELRTPLTVIKALAGYIEKKAICSSPSAKIYLQKMNNQINRMAFLVDNIFDSTQIKINNMVIKYENIKIDSLIHEIVDDFKLISDRKNIKIVGKSGRIILSDKHRIAQVLINLLSNANKYSQKDKDITLTVSNKGKTILVAVKDMGVGIPANRNRDIFRKYQRLGSSAKSSAADGLGLGLYIVKEIVNHLGGRLQVESQLGKGSNFCFILPISPVKI